MFCILKETCGDFVEATTIADKSRCLSKLELDNSGFVAAAKSSYTHVQCFY